MLAKARVAKGLQQGFSLQCGQKRDKITDVFERKCEAHVRHRGMGVCGSLQSSVASVLLRDGEPSALVQAKGDRIRGMEPLVNNSTFQPCPFARAGTPGRQSNAPMQATLSAMLNPATGDLEQDPSPRPGPPGV